MPNIMCPLRIRRYLVGFRLHIPGMGLGTITASTEQSAPGLTRRYTTGVVYRYVYVDGSLSVPVSIVLDLA